MNYLDISNTSYVSHSEAFFQQLRGRSSLKDRCFVVLGEFSEVYGPLALKIVPDDVEKSVQEEISNFIVQVMAVDYTGTHAGVPTYCPADTSMLYQHMHTKSRISAFVHYFNLHDVKARGYSRIFTLSFITSPDNLFPNITAIKSCFEGIAKVCHVENVLRFHSEMLNKRINFANDVIERRQIRWWLNEMERQHSLASPPECPDEPEPTERRVSDDIGLTVSHPACTGDTGPTLAQSWSPSLPSLLQCSREKYAKKQTAIKCGEGSLRDLPDLVPIAHCFLERSMVQLYKSRGISGSLKKQREKETPTLAIGRYALQFPRPTFTSEEETTNKYKEEESMRMGKDGSSQFYIVPRLEQSDEEGFTTVVGESTFYNKYEHFSDIDWAAREALEGEEEEEERSREPSFSEGNTYDILLNPQLDFSLKSSDPPFIGAFNRSLMSNSGRKLYNSKPSISCCYPKTIELDIFRFRHILKSCYRDLVFSVLSGRPVVIIGNENSEMSSSFKNALSLFITCPQRVCAPVLSELKLEDLGKYTLIQCKRNAATVKTVECFAQSGLCSVIHHEKRSGKAPRYRGNLIPRMWAEEGSRNIPNYSERTLFSAVQTGIVSELAFELLDKYYSLLLDKECSVEGVLGTSPDDQCDLQIYKFQILLLLNPSSSLLSSSHNLNSEFKYSYNTRH